ncbi:hypothetical protein ACLQ25_09400 [Micromonospora sp. DT44]|uniref:hypothetical protein n=1 Tax=Micromonospora sp. DT44 TaxID=3393439 RepID=UPI003CE9335F
MTIDDVREAATTLVDLAQRHGQPVLFGAGATAALLALVLVWRFLRTGEVHEKLGRVAVTLATLFAMEGMFEVAHGPLDLNVAGSLMFCATFEVVMLHQGSLAAHKLAAHTDGPAPDISRHMRFVWLVAGASGLVASTASDSVTEVVLRLATPPLAAGIWYMSLYADKEPAERQPSRWIWTPQRIGVRLGLLKPGTVDDLAEVFRQRAVRRIVDAAVIVWHADKARAAGELDDATAKHAAKAGQRLDDLAKTVDQATMAAAQQQIRLTLGIRQQLFAGIEGGEVDGWTRQQLDQTSAEARRAALRSKIHAARAQRALTRPRTESMVEMGGIVMPAHLAARIGPLPDPAPVHSGGSLDALVEAVAEPVRESTHLAIDSPRESAPTDPDESTRSADPSPRRESVGGDSPNRPSAARRTTRRTVTEPVGESTQQPNSVRLAAAWERFIGREGREPSDQELADEAGLSKATANRWKNRNDPTLTEEK